VKKLIPLLAFALISSTAIADDKDKPAGSSASFEALDKDSDQRLSQAEAAADQNASARFTSLDADGDGYLTKREFKVRSKSEPRPMSEPPMRDNPRPDPY
jgi:hypothetical protein